MIAKTRKNIRRTIRTAEVCQLNTIETKKSFKKTTITIKINTILATPLLNKNVASIGKRENFPHTVLLSNIPKRGGYKVSVIALFTHIAELIPASIQAII
jgi:hypothetical protein